MEQGRPVIYAWILGTKAAKREDKIQEILALKRRLGFPDARMEPLREPDVASAPVNRKLEKPVRQVVAAGRAVAGDQNETHRPV